jgi:dUTP pyrophosphatase
LPIASRDLRCRTRSQPSAEQPARVNPRPAIDPLGALRVTRLDSRALLPSRAHADDAGLDLHSIEPVTLAPAQRARVRTGIAVAIPPGYAGLVLPRSGLAARHGIALVNAPGLIDAGYRGELQVLLLNTDANETCQLGAGDRIAQLALIAVATPEVLEVDELDATERLKRWIPGLAGLESLAPPGLQSRPLAADEPQLELAAGVVVVVGAYWIGVRIPWPCRNCSATAIAP